MFEDFRSAVKKHFDDVMAKEDVLYRVRVDHDEMYNLYLDSFPEGSNGIFRKCRIHDCSCCHHFISRMGGVVAIINNEVVTIWDVQTGDPVYDAVTKVMAEYIRNKPIEGIFLSTEKKMGAFSTFGMVEETSVEFPHFHISVPNQFIRRGEQIGEELNDASTSYSVFARAVKEISPAAVRDVLELMGSNSLYRGNEYRSSVIAFDKAQKEYQKCSTEREAELFLWHNSNHLSASTTHIKNTAIGTLLVDLSNGMNLDSAVAAYEAKTAPENYKRSKPLVTKAMLERAEATVKELGYMDSMAHRFATLEDISANNVLFMNRDAAKRIKGGNIFSEMMDSVGTDVKKFSRVDTISIQDFIQNVLPTAREIELLLENRHVSNMVSLLAPENPDAPSMYKWENGFGWAYVGNLADSSIKKNVKGAGGKVDGALRFSIQWNDGEELDQNDVDAHCKCPRGEHIYFSVARRLVGGGMLDVDIVWPDKHTPAVENIVFADAKKMAKGKYEFYVHCYSYCGGRSGFRAEIEANGETHSYDYRAPLRQDEKIPVATVEFDGSSFKIVDRLESSVSTRDVWGLSTGHFIPVTLICYSPNYWDEQTGCGNRHYIFGLKGAINTERPNSLFNEYLRSNLHDHRRVFELLGSRLAVPDSDDQVSGVGFSDTRRNDVIVRVTGATERVMKVTF